MMRDKLKNLAKTLLCVLLGLLFYQIHHVAYSYWVLITIIALLPTTTGATIQKAIARILGTLSGLLVGLLLVAILPATFSFPVMILSVFLMFYTVMIRYRYAMFFGGIIIVFALVHFLEHGSMNNAWQFVLARFTDTLIGGVIVIVVSKLFWSDNPREQAVLEINQIIIEGYQSLSKVCDQLLLAEKPAKECLSQFYQSIIKLQTLNNESKGISNSLLSQQLIIEAILNNAFIIHRNLVALEMNAGLIHHDLLQDTEAKQIFEQFHLVLAKTTQKLQQQPNHQWKDYQLDNQFLDLSKQLRRFESEQLQPEHYSVALNSLLLNLRDTFIALRGILVAATQLIEEAA